MSGCKLKVSKEEYMFYFLMICIPFGCLALNNAIKEKDKRETLLAAVYDHLEKNFAPEFANAFIYHYNQFTKDAAAMNNPIELALVAIIGKTISSEAKHHS